MFTRLHKGLAALIGSGALVAGALAGAGAAAPAFAAPSPSACVEASSSVTAGVVTKTFDAIGADCLYTVPSGVTSVTMTTNGAQGGQGNTCFGSSNPGVLGGQATLTFTVSAGQSFIFEVGSQGGAGPYASGGTGGALTGAPGAVSTVFTVCGGGGGGGGTFVWNGSDGDTANDTLFLAGGGGGGTQSGFTHDNGGGGGGGGYSSVSSNNTATGAAAVDQTDGPSGLNFFNSGIGGTGGATADAQQAGDGTIIVSYAADVATTTTIALTSGTNPSILGQSLTFTATVVPGDSGAPTGYVQFRDDGNLLPGNECDSVPLSTTTPPYSTTPPFTAICTLSDLAAGDHHITAQYFGNTFDQHYTGSTSDPLEQMVIAVADTTVTLSSTPNPSVYGQPFVITATVTANPPAVTNPPDGYVYFTIDGQTGFCQEGNGTSVNVTSVSNVTTATCTVSDYYELEELHVGNHTINATYYPNGDPAYNPSETAILNQVITPASTTTTASAMYVNWAPVPTVAITATVTINPPSILSFSPSVGLGELYRGTVSFFNGSTLLCTVPLNEWGQALCESAINPATVAPHSLTAIYNWDGTDADFLPSSATTDQVPTHAGPVITSVTSVFPNNGQAWLVQGAGFSGASSVTVCGISVPFTVVSDTVMLIGVPAVNGPQQCTIIIVATGGTASTNGTVTVVPQPQPGAPVVVYPTGPTTPTCGPTDSITLSGLWTLVAWSGQDGMSVKDALAGGTDGCGSNITAQIAVIWGFDAATQTYYAYFPSAANVPGANDLTSLKQGLGYWFALVDPTTTVIFKVERGA